MPQIDQFSFILGVIVALVIRWALARVWDWLTGIFKPSSDKPLGQKIAESVRKLIAALLVLAALTIMGYIVYSVWFK
jgi:type II secretory pathway component PulL